MNAQEDAFPLNLIHVRLTRKKEKEKLINLPTNQINSMHTLRKNLYKREATCFLASDYE